MRVRFVWDPAKAESNRRKHGLSFDEAVTVFTDPLALVMDEPNHGERLIIIGMSQQERMLYCVFIEVQANKLRIISARRTTPHERRQYEEGA